MVSLPHEFCCWLLEHRASLLMREKEGRSKNKKQPSKASEMTQRVKTFATKLDYLSSIPRTQHMVEGDGQLSKVVLQSPHACHGTCVPPLQLIKKKIKMSFKTKKKPQIIKKKFRRARLGYYTESSGPIRTSW